MGNIEVDGKLMDIMAELMLAVNSWWEFAVGVCGEEKAYKCLKSIVKVATKTSFHHEVWWVEKQEKTM